VDLSGCNAESFLLLDGVKTAAMDHPQLWERFASCRRFLEISELAVEPREVVRLTDPHNARKNVKPASEKI
jgi:hypothetical protein